MLNDYPFYVLFAVLLPFFLILQVIFVVVTRLAGTYSNDHLGAVVLYTILLYGPILFFTVLVHELGHCLACRQIGGEAHSILLWPLGGLAFIGHEAGVMGVKTKIRTEKQNCIYKNENTLVFGYFALRLFCILSATAY